jgi:hypothetical protein
VQGISGSGAGVSGHSSSGVGVSGFSDSGVGLVAQADNEVPGTIGLIATGNAFAGQFDGNVVVSGELQSAGKNRRQCPSRTVLTDGCTAWRARKAGLRISDLET